MISHLPQYINILFILCTLFSVYALRKATNSNKLLSYGVLLWLTLQAFVGLSGFYTETDVIPPRFLLLIAPPLLLIVLLFVSKNGKAFIDSTDKKWLTWLHVVRIPVEITLYLLFIHGQIPEVMTFEGRNFDILAGLTAPFIAWFGYHRSDLGKGIKLAWNFIFLAVLLNVVVHAVLSAPFPFQQMAFDQPNVGVFYFPFVWLPGFIVPAVIFSHLAAIRALLKE